MQTNLAVSGNAITGTLKYLSTGALPAGWGNGNFMALKFGEGTPGTITRVGLEPSVSSGLVELDEDRNAVCQVTDKDTQKFVVETTDGVNTHKEYYDLSGLTLQDAGA